MIFTPLLGLYVDKRGKRATLIGPRGANCWYLATCSSATPHFPPVVADLLHRRCAVARAGCAVGRDPMMVPESRLGTAFGVVGYVQNVGLMLVPYLAGKIADAHTTMVNGQPVVDYTSTMLMFASLGIGRIVFSLLLKATDRAARAASASRACFSSRAGQACVRLPGHVPYERVRRCKVAVTAASRHVRAGRVDRAPDLVRLVGERAVESTPQPSHGHRGGCTRRPPL